jgi:hypothetical protein
MITSYVIDRCLAPGGVSMANVAGPARSVNGSQVRPRRETADFGPARSNPSPVSVRPIPRKGSRATIALRATADPTMDAVFHCDTPTLRIACLAGGPVDGRPVLLLHGWPDDATTWDAVVPALHAAGCRTYRPWLRGFGATRFRSERTR